jgi:uncharacterized protein with von Willebrand factor type A (vWA) domain
VVPEPKPDAAESRLWYLFGQLRRRRFPLSPDDLEALHRALLAGFGWTGRAALRELCCALWAKSRRERDILVALFDQLDWPDWRLPRPEPEPALPLIPESEAPAGRPALITEGEEEGDEEVEQKRETDLPQKGEPPPATRSQWGLPPISLEGVNIARRPFVFVPQFPLTYREVAQAWRRLRRPVREGPPTELNLEETVARWCRQGTPSAVVLRPRRRNTTRLLLLVDRHGSMDPFHDFVDDVCTAILEAGRLKSAAVYYFHDVPAEGSDLRVLGPLADQMYPDLAQVLPEIAPLTDGLVYHDKDLFAHAPLRDVLNAHAAGAAVVLISDAGAAKRRYDTPRLLDTIAFLKGLRSITPRFVWLNPLPRRCWTRTTCEAIARHVPMFPLDRDGIYHAVNALRGQVYDPRRLS